MSETATSPADRAFRMPLRWLSPAGRGARLSVVLFHRVLSAPDPMFPDDIDRYRFEAICDWLVNWFNVMPLDEALQRALDGRLPERALAITFDDGYADNHDLALPILRARGLVATFFIASAFLDGGRMWNDTIIESVRRCTQPVLDLESLGLPNVGPIDLQTTEQRRGAANRLLGAVKYLPMVQREQLANRVATLAGASLPDDLMMTSAQLRTMAAAGMQIGAHTVNHPILARLDDQEADTEINAGKRALEELLQQPMTMFAYPNGKPRQDYVARDVELARNAGFTAAVSTAYGAWRPPHADRFQIPRFTPWDTGRRRFGLRMARNFLVQPETV